MHLNNRKKAAGRNHPVIMHFEYLAVYEFFEHKPSFFSKISRGYCIKIIYVSHLQMILKEIRVEYNDCRNAFNAILLRYEPDLINRHTRHERQHDIGIHIKYIIFHG